MKGMEIDIEVLFCILWHKTVMLRAHKGLIRVFIDFQSEIQIDEDFEIPFFWCFIMKFLCNNMIDGNEGYKN